MITRFTALLGCILLTACGATSIESQPAILGQPSTWEAMEAVIDEPGPIKFEKHLAARWAVDLSGLVNLDSPKAESAGFFNDTATTEIYTYSLAHPSEGTYLVDSGISESLRVPEENPDIGWPIKLVLDTDALQVVQTTLELDKALDGIDGVFLTHIHLDHILGISDLAPGTPLFVGWGESANNKFEHIATQGTTDRMIANGSQPHEWQFGDEGIVDIFGDESVFAIHSPGHTPGSTVYLVRTTDGPELLLGDTCHTAWGWNNGVEPGSFSDDRAMNAVSLTRFIELAKSHPRMGVHPGHQSL
jgi:glyoxylase-like metal-dependent hydrolase (beta-lactamase superfamily II)